jgi:hypothetical protein
MTPAVPCALHVRALARPDVCTRRRGRSRSPRCLLWPQCGDRCRHVFTLKRSGAGRRRPRERRGKRVETERFKPFSYEELIARDKVNLDITWLKDPALDDADALLPPEVIAAEIVEDLQAALTEFAAVAEALQAAANRRAAASDGDRVSGDE